MAEPSPPVFDISDEAEGAYLHNGLQDEHRGEEKVEDLQSKLQSLWANW